MKLAEINLFRIAAKQKFRFESVRGDLTLEQLFDLPLTSRTGFDLDTVARTVNNDLKAIGEESFVEPANNAGRLQLQRKLDLVKLVIAEKQAAAAAADARATKAARRQEILTAMEAARRNELGAKSPEELAKMLEELDEPAELEDA